MKQVKPTTNNPIHLILDNHESHCNVAVIEKARQYNIVIVTLPPHCSHKLQPLYVTLFGPFKTAYSRAIGD